MAKFTTDQQNEIREAVESCQTSADLGTCVLDELNIPTIPTGAGQSVFEFSSTETAPTFSPDPVQEYDIAPPMEVAPDRVEEVDIAPPLEVQPDPVQEYDVAPAQELQIQPVQEHDTAPMQEVAGQPFDTAPTAAEPTQRISDTAPDLDK